MRGAERPGCAPVVILGLSPGGLYLVRDLARAGVPVYGAADKRESGLFSRYLRGGCAWKIRDNRDDQERVDTDSGELLRRIRELQEAFGIPPVLLPSSDRYIEWISKHYTELREYARFSDTYRPDRYERLLDKDLFYQVCEKIGVPYPRRWKLADLNSAQSHRPERDPESLSYPLLIKPGRLHEVTEIMGSRKVFECRDAEELKKYLQKLPQERGGWLVQEIVEGPDDDIYCLGGVHSGEGRIEAPIAGRKLRQFPPGFGTAAALRIESPPEVLWEHTRRLLMALEVDGIFEIEFKRDLRDGIWKVFEINPRTALWFSAAGSAGVPLAMRAYCTVAGCELPLSASTDGTKSTVVWRTGLKNIIAVGRAIFRRSGGKGGPGAGKGKVRPIAAWAFWDSFDPLPACMELLAYAGKAAGRLYRAVFKGRGRNG